MAAAEEAGARVLLGFGHSRGSNEKRLPSAAEFRREFLRFRARYPLVRDYLTWNEANHCSQPTCRRPERAARYFDVVAANCRGCRVVAADVLDDSRVERWVRRFKAAARYKPRIWGIHNYVDANRFRTTGTRTLLRITKGEVWFTETGGLVERRNERRIVWPRSSARAARALEQVFKLARLSPRRVTRVYLYQWDPAGHRQPGADLGLGADGWPAAGPVPPTTCCATGWPRRPPGAPAAPAECGPAPFSPFSALAALGGCGSEAGITRGGTIIGDTLTVYSMLPQPSQGVSRDVLDGEKLALAEAGGTAGAMGINFVSLDEGAEDPAETVSRAASASRDAISDPQIIAVIDGLDSATAMTTVPLFNAAGVLQVSPGAGYPGLTSRAAPGEPERYQPAGVPTFARVVGDDRDEAVALAAAAGSRGTVAVQREPGPESAALAAAVRAPAARPRRSPGRRPRAGGRGDLRGR